MTERQNKASVEAFYQGLSDKIDLARLIEDMVKEADYAGAFLSLDSEYPVALLSPKCHDVSMGCVVLDVPHPCGCQGSFEELLQASYDLGPTTGPQATRLLTPSFVPKDPKDG